MNTTNVIRALNQAVRLEHAATLQYRHQGLVLRGLFRQVYRSFFFDSAEEAGKHARKFGQKIVALGGEPTTEVGPVTHHHELVEMLEADLALERQALDAYRQALVHAEGDVALTNMLEDQIQSEQEDVEELELILAEATEAKASRPRAAS